MTGTIGTCKIISYAEAVPDGHGMGRAVAMCQTHNYRFPADLYQTQHTVCPVGIGDAIADLEKRIAQLEDVINCQAGIVRDRYFHDVKK